MRISSTSSRRERAAPVSEEKAAHALRCIAWPRPVSVQPTQSPLEDPQLIEDTRHTENLSPLARPHLLYVCCIPPRHRGASAASSGAGRGTVAGKCGGIGDAVSSPGVQAAGVPARRTARHVRRRCRKSCMGLEDGIAAVGGAANPSNADRGLSVLVCGAQQRYDFLAKIGFVRL